jgi:DeoR family transcriptional regulator, fructose operon transcriptional repressor
VTAAPLRYDAAPVRRQRILAALRERGFLSVADLAQRLGVSDMTVRRDLRRLRDLGEVRIVHGGASLLHGTLQTPGFIARAGAQSEPKRLIAARAVGLVRPEDSIAIDAGTTAYELAVALPDTFAGTVVTHSVPVVSYLLHRPGARVVGIGGELHPDSQAFVGPMTVEAARRLRVRTLFLGAAAVDERGVYVDADVERPTKLALMEVAEAVVLLADSSKFDDTSAAVLLCPLDRLRTVVTDRPPPRRTAARLRRLGTEVLLP